MEEDIIAEGNPGSLGPPQELFALLLGTTSPLLDSCHHHRNQIKARGNLPFYYTFRIPQPNHWKRSFIAESHQALWFPLAEPWVQFLPATQHHGLSFIALPLAGATINDCCASRAEVS